MHATVPVPKGIVAGQQFITTIRFYKCKFRITVPSGVTSGKLLYITFPPPSVQQTEKEIIDISNDFISNEEGWKLNLGWIIKYIDENKKRPSSTDKNEHIKKQGRWLCNQTIDYKKTQKIMAVSKIRQLWEDFTNKYKYILNKKLKI
jgi:hypothetical protein